MTTNVGTDFWVAFPANFVTNPTIKFFISSNFSTSGTVSSAVPGVDQNFTVVPGIVTEVILPYEVALVAGIEDKGIHVVANDPISLYGLNRKTASTDAYLALPVNALGLDYTIVSYTTTYAGKGSSFCAVAAQNGTTLTVYNHQTNSTSTINLNQGQTYYVKAPVIGEDITGSRIQSNVPVAVFGSVEATYVPAGCSALDHIVEQMFPYYSWGKNFITVPLAGRDASGDIFRIVAAEDGTNISINGTLTTTINTGDFYETNLTGFNSITTSKATILAQFAKSFTCSGNITGDPFMMLIPPREQFLTNYTVTTLTGFSSHWVNIVAPDYALNAIYQDGVLIPVSAFTQVGTTGFYGAQRSVLPGAHTFNSTFPFGVFVYGWNPADSYGYPGGCSLSPVGTVNSVTISPPTLTGTLNISTLCYTAHVADNFMNPVAGVLVNFNISGISNITGNAYTDASGNAQYCYARTGTTPGTDNIYAEVFGFTSTTSTAIWNYSPPPCVNPTNGGSIGSNQVGCGSFTPVPLTNITLPAGYTGTLEYKWQESTTSGVAGFSDIAGSNTPGFSPGSLSQTTWYRRLARVNCMSDWNGAAMTTVVEMTVNTPVIPSVTIGANPLQVCAGENVTFTATPVNGGSAPTYQWKVNAINANNASNAVFTYTPSNGDVVSCVMTSSEVCVSGNPATSNSIAITVYPLPAVTANATSTAVCTGSSVTLTGSGAVSYVWNNGVFNGVPFVPASTNTYTVTGTDANGCSNTAQVTVSVIPALPVSVSVSPSANPVCTGTPIVFTATPVNGGTTPAYEWKVNGTISGTNSSVFSYTPASGDLVSCILTSSEPCTTGNPASCIPYPVSVLPLLPVSVTISASENPVCNGTAVTFTALPVNPGNSPAYHWKVNAINAANATNSVYTYTPVSGDLVSCILASSETCTSGNPASCIPYPISVLPILPVSVTISASENPVCDGTPATYTALPVNGGTTPSYQWKVNGTIAGTNSSAFTYTPVSGDLVSCILTSSEPCTSGNPASCIPYPISVVPLLPVSVSIAASANPFCSGTAVTFTAAANNGGTAPTYQWKVNASNAGNASNATFSYNPVSGDLVSCILTSNLACVTSNPATSPSITMSEMAAPNVSFTACFDTVTYVNAQPIRLKGGLPPGGSYSGPGVNSTTGIFTPSSAGAGIKTITYSYSNVYTCMSSTTKTILIKPAPSFTCGSTFTDPRDNKAYQTVQIGTQCWMSSNLDFGFTIDDLTPQTDNCLAERYLNTSTFVAQYSIFYQWDELMQYTTTEGTQGLCPPGWHIPTSAEWGLLLNYYEGPGQAAGPMKDIYLANGFQSSQDGFLYLNHTWAFETGLYAGSMYWTSTSSGADRAVARGLNEFNQSVSLYEAARGNAFSVRCLKD
jgi:uncharacterized protein (TIGR02145 family)